MIPVFEKAIPVLDHIEKAGYEAYFVGGCVRDNILGREISDIDIATSATPNEIKKLFSKTVDVGIQHGTVVVLWEKEAYELTTFRSDGEYVDFRRPSEVTFIRNLHDDLQRRDFTMNSIAMDKKGNLIDPFKGFHAIKNKTIETVGDASERFHEDALRMMRAVRFVSQLQFSLEQNTYQALIKYGPLLEKVAIERKTVEFEKLLRGKGKRHAIQILVDTGLFKYLPGLLHDQRALCNLTLLEIDSLTEDEIWTLLLYLMEIPINSCDGFLRQWKLPVKKMKQISSVLQLLHNRFYHNWTIERLYHSGLEEAIHTEKVFNVIQHQPVLKEISTIEKLYSDLIIKDRQELAVTGNDLMKWNNEDGGPWIKEQLQFIEEAVLSGRVDNDKDKIREWLVECNQM
ncbi:CCA tRNA nucleotidyltransferase [Niallia sp. Krafla_26]|uniref:CCA tRNA nucleotidyltransferase n=1 Tax=Niallia sp. Krafla_26 TaxID=3064703 RepID=UPI003D17F8F6